MLEKYFETGDNFGSIVLYRDTQKGLFVVEPKGIINPNLVKVDLKEAYAFGEKFNKNWVYLVDTSKVTFPNPINLFYLKKIRVLPYVDKYVIYTPSAVVRFLATLTSFIIKPDIVLKTDEEFQTFLSSK